jgi:hypothetical protein
MKKFQLQARKNNPEVVKEEMANQSFATDTPKIM